MGWGRFESAPFKEWLDSFSIGNDPEFDGPYFDNITTLLVDQIGNKLVSLFQRYMLRHKGLNIQVFTGPKKEPSTITLKLARSNLQLIRGNTEYSLFSFAPSVKTNCISIKAWPKEIDSVNSESLKALQEDPHKAKILKNCKTALFVAIFGAIAMYVLAQSYKNIMH